MANIPLKTIKFPGLDDTYTVPQVDNTLSVTGAAADAKKTGDELTELNERLDDETVKVTPQTLTDAQKLCARENIGAKGTTYEYIVIYDASASPSTVLFTSDDVEDGVHVIYDMLLPVLSDGYGKSAYVELLDTQGNRLGVYGRLSTSPTAETVFQGEFDVPEGFAQAVWRGDGTVTTIATSVKLTKLVEIEETRNYVRYDVNQNLTEEEQQQARINIGLEPPIINVSFFDDSPTHNQTLFDSDDVAVGDTLTYSITLPPNPNMDNLGFIELLDSSNTRLGIYGRISGSDTATEFEGSFIIPINFDHARWFELNLPSGTKSVVIRGSYKEIALFSGTAVSDDTLFTSDDVPVGAKVSYSFNIIDSLHTGHYPAAYLAIYLSDGTRYSWYGKGSTNTTQYDNPYEGTFTIPEDFAYAMWQGQSSCSITYIKAVVPYDYDTTSATIENPYKRYSIKEYGTLYRGYPHVAFPRICAFNNSLVVVYRCAMRHRTENGNGVVQIDTIGLDGQHKHVKVLSPSDFAGVTGTDARDFYCMCAPDGEHLILFGGFGKGTASSGYTFDLVMVCLDKNFAIVSYKVIANSTDYPYGNMLITPQGKLIFSTFNQSLTDSAIYCSEQVFTNYVTSLSSLTFTKTTLFTTSNTGVSSFSECCLGYFNDSLIVALRIDATATYTPVRVTNDLEGASGWGDVIRIQGVLSHSPVLLPHYYGRYLPYMCSKRDTSTGAREPLFGYIDMENNQFLCYENIDKTLITAPNGYPWFYNLGGEIYAVVYYQESTTNSETATPEQSNTGLYYKWINGRVVCPQINNYNLSN